MKLVAYIRTSTSKQDLGLAVQEEGISAYAKLYGHELVETIEEQVSAKNLQRDGLKKALGMVEAGTVDAIIVYKIDRISRSVADLASMVSGPLANGGLVSVSEQLDTSTANGKLMLNILSSMAQFEREQLGERTSAALQALKKQGKKLGRPRATAKRRHAKLLRNKGWTLKKIGEELAWKEGRAKPYTTTSVSNLLK